MRQTVRTSKNTAKPKAPTWVPAIGEYCWYTPARLKSRRSTLPRNASLVHRIDVSRAENTSGYVKFAYVESGLTVRLKNKTFNKALNSGRIKPLTEPESITVSP